jgi:hypothetical protein
LFFVASGRCRSHLIMPTAAVVKCYHSFYMHVLLVCTCIFALLTHTHTHTHKHTIVS